MNPAGAPAAEPAGLLATMNDAPPSVRATRATMINKSNPGVFLLIELRGRLESTIPQREGRKDQQIQRGRCDESAQNDDGHWTFDLFAGLTAPERERQE